jgi:hypothetical protein
VQPNKLGGVGFEVFTAVVMKTTLFKLGGNQSEVYMMFGRGALFQTSDTRRKLRAHPIVRIVSRRKLKVCDSRSRLFMIHS